MQDLRAKFVLEVDAAEGRNNVAKVESAWKKMADEVRRPLGQVTLLQKAVEDAKDASAAWFAARERLALLKDQAQQAGTPIKALSEHIKAAQKETDGARAAFDKKTAGLKTLRAELAGAGIDTRRLADEQARLVGRMAMLDTLKAERLPGAQRQDDLASRRETISSAVQALGMRSTSAIREEMARIQGAFATVSQSGALSAADLARAATLAQGKLGALRAELLALAPAGNATSEAIAHAGHRMAALAASAFGAERAIALVKDVVKTGLAAESLKTTFTFAAGGDVERAGRDMAFAKGIANQLGLELSETVHAYAKLSAASKGTALEGARTQEIFRAIASASAVMGLSAQESSGALLAVSQMISKGTISAEELRRQLGEHLPGAFELAAKSMNMNMATFNKLMETGQLSAEQFLPGFARTLQESVNGALPAAEQSARASLQRLENQFTEFKATIASSGVMKALSEEIGVLLTRLKSAADSGELQAFAKGMAETIGKAVKLLGDAAQAAVRFKEEISAAIKAVSAYALGKLTLELMGLAGGLGAVAGGAGLAARSVTLFGRALLSVPYLAAGAAILYLGEKAVQAAARMGEGRRAMRAWRDTVEKLASDHAHAAGNPIKGEDEIARMTDRERAAYRDSIVAASTYNQARAADLAQSGDSNSPSALHYQAEYRRYAEHLEHLEQLDKLREKDESRLASNVMAIKRGMLANLKEHFAQQSEAYEQANKDLDKAKQRRESLVLEWAALADKLAAAQRDPTGREEKALQRERRVLDAQAKQADDAATARKAAGENWTDSLDPAKSSIYPNAEQDAKAGIAQRRQQIDDRLAAIAQKREEGPSASDLNRLLLEFQRLAEKARTGNNKSDFERAFQKSGELRQAIEKSSDSGMLSDPVLGYFRRVGEQGANELSAAEEGGARKRLDDAAQAMAKLKGLADELRNTPIALHLVLDPNNLDAIKGEIEKKLANVQVAASPGTEAQKKADTELGNLGPSGPGPAGPVVTPRTLPASPWDNTPPPQVGGIATQAAQAAAAAPSMAQRAATAVGNEYSAARRYRQGDGVYGDGTGAQNLAPLTVHLGDGRQIRGFVSRDTHADAADLIRSTADQFGQP